MNTWFWIAICGICYSLGGFTNAYLNVRMLRRMRRDRIGGYLR